MTSALQMARERLVHVYDSIEVLRRRLDGLKAPQLASDDVLMDACSYRIAVIGEAIDLAKSKAPNVFAQVKLEGTTWDGLVAIRNGFIHQYGKVTADAILKYHSILDQIEQGVGRVIGLL